MYSSTLCNPTPTNWLEHVVALATHKTFSSPTWSMRSCGTKTNMANRRMTHSSTATTVYKLASKLGYTPWASQLEAGYDDSLPADSRACQATTLTKFCNNSESPLSAMKTNPLPPHLSQIAIGRPIRCRQHEVLCKLSIDGSHKVAQMQVHQHPL